MTQYQKFVICKSFRNLNTLFFCDRFFTSWRKRQTWSWQNLPSPGQSPHPRPITTQITQQHNESNTKHTFRKFLHFTNQVGFGNRIGSVGSLWLILTDWLHRGCRSLALLCCPAHLQQPKVHFQGSRAPRVSAQARWQERCITQI